MKSFSEETRRKMSESAKRRCADPAWIEAQKNRGTKLDFNAVKTMYERGMTQVEIAAELHTTQKEEFPIAVTKHHFPDEEAEAGGNGG